MIEIGKLNTMKVSRFVDFGAFLIDENNVEILLPQRYVTEDLEIGKDIEVFIYTDSEDRLVAVTDKPKAMVGEFVLLKAVEVNNIGAFLDWGLPKDLLVPFREQKVKMEPGRSYIVYIYVDDNTKRVVASAKLDKFLDNKVPKYGVGDVADVLIAKKTDLGYKVILDNLFWGMIYHNEIFSPVNIGEHHKAHIKTIRKDGKLDLILGGKSKDRTVELADNLVHFMENNDNSMPYSDVSSPDEIKSVFSCSKKDFKKAIGYLLKHSKIKLDNNITYLVG